MFEGLIQCSPFLSLIRHKPFQEQLTIILPAEILLSANLIDQIQV